MNTFPKVLEDKARTGDFVPAFNTAHTPAGSQDCNQNYWRLGGSFLQI